MAAKVNDGVFFVGRPGRPVCSKCVSSLDWDDPCHGCGGSGWVDADDDGCDDAVGVATCPECSARPSGWTCPTCKRHWDYHDVRREAT